MTSSNSENSENSTAGSAPEFTFEVDLGNGLTGIVFQEVSGLYTEHQVIEYRAGNSAQFSTIKMPGIVKYGNVTLKRGVFVNDNVFWTWRNQIQMNTIARTTVLIKLIDEAGDITMQWQLLNAWPTKVTSTDLKSDGNEIAIDTLEIAHEQLTVINGK